MVSKPHCPKCIRLVKILPDPDRDPVNGALPECACDNSREASCRRWMNDARLLVMEQKSRFRFLPRGRAVCIDDDWPFRLRPYDPPKRLDLVLRQWAEEEETKTGGEALAAILIKWSEFQHVVSLLHRLRQANLEKMEQIRARLDKDDYAPRPGRLEFRSPEQVRICDEQNLFGLEAETHEFSASLACAQIGLPATPSTIRFVLWKAGLRSEPALPSRGIMVTSFGLRPFYWVDAGGRIVDEEGVPFEQPPTFMSEMSYAIEGNALWETDRLRSKACSIAAAHAAWYKEHAGDEMPDGVTARLDYRKESKRKRQYSQEDLLRCENDSAFRAKLLREKIRDEQQKERMKLPEQKWSTEESLRTKCSHSLSEAIRKAKRRAN